MADLPPDAFLSYTRFDDRHDGGAITEFCGRLASAVRAVTGAHFEIFQDVDGIGVMEHWPGKLADMLDQARFFIPVVTPNYFTSEACRAELDQFLKAETGRGRNDLVLPIYYIECDVLEESELRAADPLASVMHERQHQDWRELRYQPFTAIEVRKSLERLARGIARARRRVVPAPQPATSRTPQQPSPRPTRTTPPPVVAPGPTHYPHPNALEPGTVFRDIDAPWCPEMVVIPPGSFLMGSPESEDGRYDDQRPQHPVTIPHGLAVGCCPVTFEEYDHFCQASGLELPSDEGWGRGRRPAINISWDDAQRYVAWLAKETGQAYRLLSESEWEYACRAETTTRYWWGDGITPENANYSGSELGRTSEVGSYLPNAFQLHDTHGNVWEWCEDRWHGNYEGAPDDGSAWVGGKISGRVVRGGFWVGGPRYLRAACRSGNGTDIRGDYLGFRLARTLTP